MDRDSEPHINHHQRLPLRRISSEAHIIKHTDLKGRPYGLKNDSFYICDPYLLRTIFDDAKEVIASFDLERNYRPIKGNTIHVINELKVEDDVSSSNEEVPKPSTPEEKRDFIRHRSSSDTSSTNPITTATSLPSEEPTIPSIYELKKRRSQSIDINDVQDLTKVMKKAKSFKEYIEESYYELFTYILARQEREDRLMQTPWKSTFEKETMIREHRKRETILLRSRRLCGRLQDFEVLKKVGKGAFGDVFLSRRRKTGELLALKRIHKSKLENKNQIANIKAEQDVLAEASNQWLVQMYYNFQDSEYVYFAMEFIQGGNVRTLLENTGNVGEDEARFYVAEMLVAVDVLHQLGYIHRDLKPDNFLIDKDGHVKLIDFGLSTKGVAESYREPFKGQLPVVKFSPPSTTARREEFRKQRKAHYSLVGSPDYMAFEILAEAGYDFSADWWSLGCILFELLVGFPPFTAGTAREVFANVMNYHSVLENPCFEDQEEPLISPDAWDLIQKLICSPDKRIGRESVNEIKKHPFFAKINWSQIRKHDPPFKPELSGPEDTSYFEYVEDVSAEDRRTLDPNSFLKKIQSLPRGILLAREAPDISYFAKPAIEPPPPEEGPKSPIQRRMSASILSARKNSLPKSSDSIFNKLKRTSPTGSMALRSSGGNSPLRSSSPSKGGSWNETFSNLVFSKIKQPKPSMLFEHPSTAQLSDRDWKVLCTGAIRVSFKQGDVILKEGQRNSCLYRIKSGQVRVEKSKAMVLGYLHKNQVFGEMAFVEDSIPDPRNADSGNVDASIIVDSENVELYKIERSFIFSLFATDKELFARFFYVIAYVLAQRVIELPLITYEKKSKQLVLPHHDKLRSSIDPANNPDSPTNVDKIKQKSDAQFRRKFHLTSNEVLIRKYKCSLLGKRKLHGKIYIGKKHICFLGRIFGFSQKEIIYMQTVSGVKCIDSDQISITTSGGIQYDFTGFESRDETFLLLEQLYTNFSEKLENEMGEDFHDSSVLRMRRRSSVGIMSNEFQNDISVFENYYMKDLSLTQEDWGNILHKAECFHISKEEIILSQGEEEENLYQIASGTCKMERYDAQTEKTETVGHYQEREMFGETGFLLRNPSSVTIIADEDNVEIYKVEKASLEAMFQIYPGLAGKFYKFLSLMIARRIRQREMEIIRLQSTKGSNSLPHSPK